MGKNIEMNILNSDGQYESLYPYTVPDQVQNLLNDDTKEYIGLTTSATPDDAFRQLYLMNILGDKCAFTIKFVTSQSQTPLVNIPVVSTSYVDAQGNPVSGPLYTNENGEISTFFKGGSITLSISGYADIEDWSQQYSVNNGEQYNYTISLTTVNFKKWTSSGNTLFSQNVSNVDICCVGGGGGGDCNREGICTGGGGGYITISLSNNVSYNQSYSYVIGSGGQGALGELGPQGYVVAGSGGQTSFLGNVAQGGGRGGKNASYGKGNGNGGYCTSSTGGYVNPTEGSSNGYYSYDTTGIYGGGGGGGYSYPGEDGEIYCIYTTKTTYGGTPGYEYDNFTIINATNGYGGGGGAYLRLYNKGAHGGSGGSGCVAIRMHLKAT